MSSSTKRNILWGAAGFLAAVIIVNAGVIFTIRHAVVREMRSPHDLNTTVQTIAANAASQGWRASEPQEFEAEPAPAGRHAGRIRVLELYNPNFGRELVAFGRNRSVAVAPTTVVVYEEDGQVYVATINTGLIGRFFHHEPAGPIFQKVSDERKILAFLKNR